MKYALKIKNKVSSKFNNKLVFLIIFTIKYIVTIATMCIFFDFVMNI